MKPKVNKCVHCLVISEDMTWDHVFPESWYPEGQEIVDKWKVPCCKKCNNHLSKIEKRLLTYFVISIGNKNPEMTGIYEKVIRSMNPLKAKNEKDKKARQQSKDKLLNEIIFVDKNIDSVFPNLDNSNLYREQTLVPSVSINDNDIREFAKKIIRGIIYIKDKKYIEDDYEIEVLVVKVEAYMEFEKEMFKENCETYCKPGIKIEMYSAVDDFGSIMKISIWETIFLTGIILPK